MQDLPETAQVIADVIGRDATLKLASMCKHRKLYVPNTFKPDHWITGAIGEILARKLHREFRGISLDLARCHCIHVEERNARIRQQASQGVSVLIIMREHGMSLRAVRYILAGHNGRPKRSVMGRIGAAIANRKAGDSNRERLTENPNRPPGLGSSPTAPSGSQGESPSRTRDSAKSAALPDQRNSRR